MKVRTVGAASVATMCAAAVGIIAPAHADLVMRCIGEGGPVTVPGDLVVPRGKSCMLTGTTVEGDVRVAQDANLITDDATFNGRVIVASNAYLDTVGTSVADRVVLRRDGYGIYLDTSEVGGNVVAQPSNESSSDGFVYGIGSDLAGNVVSRAGNIVLDGAQVSGNVIADQAFYADLFSTFIDGRLRVSGTEAGSVVCGSAIQGQAQFTGNADIVQIGSDGPAMGCTSGSYWGGDVRVLDTSGEVYVDQNIVNGNLRLAGNDPVANFGPDNLVRGDVIGEYNDYVPAGTTSKSGPRLQTQRGQTAEAPSQRGDSVQDRAQQRRGVAEAEAEAAGKAF